MHLTGGFSMIVSTLAPIVLAIAAPAILIRRTWLRAAGIERQLDEFRNQLWNQLQLQDEAEQRREQNGRAEIQKVQRDLSVQIAAQTDVSNQILEGVAGVSAATTDLSSQISTLAETVELILRKAPHSRPIDSSFLETKTEDELIAVAESAAFLGPLIPYPRWRFDADLANPDLAFQFRRWPGSISTIESAKLPLRCPGTMAHASAFFWGTI